MSLQRKISLKVLLPMLLCLIVVSLASSVPLYFLFPEWVSDVTDKIEDNQLLIVEENSRLLASSIQSLLQTNANLVILMKSFLLKYTAGTAGVKSNFTGSMNYANGRDYFYENVTVDYDKSMWYLDYENDEEALLSQTNTERLLNFAIADVIFRPLSLSNFFREVYSAYDDDGFFYITPAKSNEFYTEPKENCSDPAGFDPRCRPWFTEVKSQGPESELTISQPYTFVGSGILGQTACISIWSPVLQVSCLDFDTAVYTEASLPPDSYIYLLSPDGIVYYHTDLDTSSEFPTIIDLEFPGTYEDRESEVQEFTDAVLPLFAADVPGQVYYSREGQT